MLKRIFSLTRVLIKTNIGAAIAKQTVGKRKIFTILLLVFAYGYLIFIAGAFSYGAITTLMVVNQHSAFISLICLINIVSSLFETFITSSNVLYLSKDNDYLLPLPFMPLKLWLAK